MIWFYSILCLSFASTFCVSGLYLWSPLKSLVYWCLSAIAVGFLLDVFLVPRQVEPTTKLFQFPFHFISRIDGLFFFFFFFFNFRCALEREQKINLKPLLRTVLVWSIRGSIAFRTHGYCSVPFRSSFSFGGYSVSDRPDRIA